MAANPNPNAARKVPAGARPSGCRCDAWRDQSGSRSSGAMSKPFDYSKWDNIELSDDESDLHPNIDKESWFRLKHRTRVEREEQEEQEKKNLTEANRLAAVRLEEIDAQLKLVAEGKEGEVDEDPEAMRAEKQQLEALVRERSDKLEEMERNKKWNWENMCTTVEERSVIAGSAVVGEANTAAPAVIDKLRRSEPGAAPSAAASASQAARGSSAPAPAAGAAAAALHTAKSGNGAKGKAAASSSSTKRVAGPVTETSEVESYSAFVEQHEALLDRFIDTENLDATRELIREQPAILLAEHAASFVLLSCLEDEMNGNHARMRLCARQSQILSHLSELGRSMNRHPRDMLDAFFVRMREGPHFMEFMAQVQGFVERIQKRAVEKRKEMEAAGAAEEEETDITNVPREERLGPGGLDPVEVFEQLPPELQAAFESRDTEQLKAVLGAMPGEEASRLLKMCVDSGLWVVNS